MENKNMNPAGRECRKRSDMTPGGKRLAKFARRGRYGRMKVVDSPGGWRKQVCVYPGGEGEKFVVEFLDSSACRAELKNRVGEGTHLTLVSKCTVPLSVKGATKLMNVAALCGGSGSDGPGNRLGKWTRDSVSREGD